MIDHLKLKSLLSRAPINVLAAFDVFVRSQMWFLLFWLFSAGYRRQNKYMRLFILV